MNDEPEPLLTQRERDFLARNPGGSLSKSATDAASKPELRSKPELKGVSGWLAFLVISFVALGPLITLFMTALEVSQVRSQYPTAIGTELWNKVEALTWFAALSYCAISIFAGYRLIKHHVRSTVPIVILCMWISGPGISFIILMIFQELSAGKFASSEAGADIGRSLISCIGWTLYLLLSKRVNNTYYSSARIPLRKRWTDLDRTNRQFFFFSGCWIILTFIYFNVVSPPDSYDDAEPNMWVVIFLPPFLIGLGAWAYQVLVGSSEP